MAWTEDDYARLGEQMRAARRDANYRTLRAFQQQLDSDPDAEVSGRTYADIESGKLRSRKKFASESLAYLEDLFGWFPGACRAILDNRKVDLFTGVSLDGVGDWPERSIMSETETSAQIDDAMADVDGRFLALEARVLELERRVMRARPPRLQLANTSGGDGDADSTEPGGPSPMKPAPMSEDAPSLRSVAKKGNVEPEDGALD